MGGPGYAAGMRVGFGRAVGGGGRGRAVLAEAILGESELVWRGLLSSPMAVACGAMSGLAAEVPVWPAGNQPGSGVRAESVWHG